MTQYKIAYKGEILPGQDPETAKKKLIRLLKGGGKKKDRILAGKPVTLKKAADEKTVEQFRRAGEKCGVVFEFTPVPQDAAPPLEKPLVMAEAPALKKPVTLQEEAPVKPDPDQAPPAETAAPRPAALKKAVCPACDFQQSASDTCINCGAAMGEADTGAGPASEGPQDQPAKPPPGEATKAPLVIPVKRSRNLFRKIRIGILLFILFIAGTGTYLTQMRSTDWEQPLWVVVYPIMGDKTDETVAAYMDSLQETDFEPIARFFVQETERYGLTYPEPFVFKLAPEVKEPPPPPPGKRSILNVMFWSLKLRLWAFKNDTYKGPSPDIRMFVIYHPATEELLEHSLGLQKGMIGVVHAYADEKSSGKNSVVIAHEVLHTVGATDKYDPETEYPLFPHGFGDPEQEPLYPQELAEIMGTRIAKTEERSVMPPNLDYTVIGPKTAQEIKWIEGVETAEDKE